MLKYFIYNIMSGFHHKSGLKRLRTLESKLLSREMRFAVPFVYRGSGYFKSIEPRQNPFEIEQLYRDVCSISPGRVLEIGTAKGGTLYLWTQAAAEDAIIISVDLPGGEFGGAYPACRVPFYKAFARDQQNLHLLRSDSHDRTTLTQVRELLANAPLDFAFIDGDHTYEGVKKDFELYGPLVRPGGLIAFHDILPRPDMPEIQVDLFWKELKGMYDTEEFIGPETSGRKIGIGIVRVGDHGITQ
ncbi:MAG: cephalosporin hydroxylase related enzyme [Nitrospirae bacterium]|nr:cephalosporin hydroxylase related enzyme [Nitrospirota bacterium]